MQRHEFFLPLEGLFHSFSRWLFAGKLHAAQYQTQLWHGDVIFCCWYRALILT